MIKIKKQSKMKKITIICLAVALLLGGIATAYWYNYQQTQKKEALKTPDQRKSKKVNVINKDKPTSEQIAAGEEAKQQAIEAAEASNSDASAQNPLSVTISAANQNSPMLQVRAFANTITNAGTCDLTLTKGGVTVTKSAGTQASASISSCKGFDIPLSELSPGTWQLTVTVKDGTQSGTAQRTVEIT
jgi:hypothetical protein